MKPRILCPRAGWAHRLLIAWRKESRPALTISYGIEQPRDFAMHPPLPPLTRHMFLPWPIYIPTTMYCSS